MSNSYFPATQALQEYQPDSMLADLAQAQAIKSSQQQTAQSAQSFPLEQQYRQQQNQIQGMQLQDAQTLRQLAPQYLQRDDQGKPTGYDLNGLIGAAAGAGVSPQVLNQLQVDHLNLQQKYADASTATMLKFRERRTIQRMNFWKESVRFPTQRRSSRLTKKDCRTCKLSEMDTGHVPQQVPTDDASLNMLEATLGMHEQALADAKTQGEAQEAAGKGAQAQADAALTNIKVRMAQNSKPGDFDSQIDHSRLQEAI